MFNLDCVNYGLQSIKLKHTGRLKFEIRISCRENENVHGNVALSQFEQLENLPYCICKQQRPRPYAQSGLTLCCLQDRVTLLDVQLLLLLYRQHIYWYARGPWSNSWLPNNIFCLLISVCVCAYACVHACMHSAPLGVKRIKLINLKKTMEFRHCICLIYFFFFFFFFFL